MNNIAITGLLTISLFASGCSMLTGEPEPGSLVMDNTLSGAKLADTSLDNSTTQNTDHYFQTDQSLANEEDTMVVKNITHYVRGIMHDLVENLTQVTSQTPIGVTSFVYLDSDLQTTSLLGNQISESFVHEIHQFGIPVVDYKMMDSLKITNEGDFVYSRDYTKLSSSVEIEFILTGTMAKHVGGYLINARIIDIESKAIVSSAQSFVPEHVARAVLNHKSKHGIRLTKG